MIRRSSVLTISAAALVVFIYLPLVVVVVYAFNGGANLNWPLHGLSLRWFRLIFGDPAFLSGLRTSAAAALSTAIVAGVIGTTAASRSSGGRPASPPGWRAGRGCP